MSAVIHGDEPAGAEALVRWAEARLPTLARDRHTPGLFLVPCLNPWGLVNNQRTDPAGRDLNRIFHRRDVAPVPDLKRALRGWEFGASLHLHEDYDAHGMYLYEVGDFEEGWGPGLLRAARSRAVPVDERQRIDNWRFKDGLLAHAIPVEDIPEHPERLHLRNHHTTRTITFETPSEFGLAQRVRAHTLLIEACLQRLTTLTKLTTKSPEKPPFPGRSRPRRHG